MAFDHTYFNAACDACTAHPPLVALLGGGQAMVPVK